MKLKIFCLWLAANLAFAGCTSQNGSETPSAPEEYSQTVFAMDTAMTLTAYGENAERAVNAAIAEINRLDAYFSVNNENSDIYRLNLEKSAKVSEETYSLISAALDYGKRTGNALDIAVYPAVKAWGFTTGEHRVPENDELEELKNHIAPDAVVLGGDSTVTLTDPLGEIDLGSVAKGYTSQTICNLFRDMGVESGILSLGGNVQTVAKKPDGSPWRIGIASPDNQSSYVGVVQLENKAAVTSGSYQRYFDIDGVRYHHIIDPKTCSPAKSGLSSVTIISDDGLLADAYSTALFIMGLDDGSAFWRASSDDFDVVFITEDGDVYITEGLKECFTPSGGITPTVIEKD